MRLNTSHFNFYTYNPPTIKSKQSPLTQLTFLNLIRLAGGVYAEIREAHIVLLFFQYFVDLLSLIIFIHYLSKSGHKYGGHTHRHMSNQERSLIRIPRKAFEKKVRFLFL